MKKILILIFFILVANCSSGKTVYWCGDHPCINNKEKELYFKKTMTVEIKNDISKESSLKSKKKYEKKMLEDKKFNKQQLLEKKRIKKEQKELAKQLRIEEKRIKKEQKEIAKQQRIEEKSNRKEKKKLLKRIKKNKLKESSKNEIIYNNNSSEDELTVSMFNGIVERIIKSNMLKSYPNINRTQN